MSQSKRPKSTLFDKWSERLKNHPLGATVVLLAVVVGGALTLWSQLASTVDGLRPTLSLVDFYPAETSDLHFIKVDGGCGPGSKAAFQFMSPGPTGPLEAAVKQNRALSLDFVFVNRSDVDAVFSSIDMVVGDVGQVAGGSPGIIIPNHVYSVEIDHKIGVQKFPLKPPFHIPGKQTGAFTIVFSPKFEGIGLCWDLHLVFHTSSGDVSTREFSMILTKFTQLGRERGAPP